MTFDHDRPTDLSEWEHTVILGDVTVRVSKVGGGTIGETYEGWWHYHYFDGVRQEEGSDLYTGTPHTHNQAALIVAEMIGA